MSDTCSAITEYKQYAEKLYLLTKHSFEILCLKTAQYIPVIILPILNAFCWIKTGKTFYLSDSFFQKLFIFSNKNSVLHRLCSGSIIDLLLTNATLDGGAMDLKNQLWNAQWDDFYVTYYDDMELYYRELNCLHLNQLVVVLVAEKKHLFITSVHENMTDMELKQYPQFIIELAIAGISVYAFYLEPNSC